MPGSQTGRGNPWAFPIPPPPKKKRALLSFTVEGRPGSHPMPMTSGPGSLLPGQALRMHIHRATGRASARTMYPKGVSFVSSLSPPNIPQGPYKTSRP